VTDGTDGKSTKMLRELDSEGWLGRDIDKIDDGGDYSDKMKLKETMLVE